MELSSYIDHTNLKADAKVEDIKRLCEEAKKYHFSTVCVNPAYIETAKNQLKGTNVQVTTVVGFPLGANNLSVKEFETIDAISSGADEIDLVVNIGAIKNGDFDYVKKEIETIRDVMDGRVLKVIVETCYLTDSELIEMVNICNDLFVNFIKTSTGFGTRGASLNDIDIINENKSEVLEIKASGGIKTESEVVEFIERGVTRIGTSHSVDIMEGR